MTVASGTISHDIKSRHYSSEGLHFHRAKKTVACQISLPCTEDSHINQTLLDSAQERAEVMKNEVAELREKLQKTSQKAKEKLQQETPTGSGSGTSHK